jgi:hypothetical protein
VRADLIAKTAVLSGPPARTVFGRYTRKVRR